MIRMTPDDLRALLFQPPVASPATHADSERLMCAIEGEPEVDQHENLAGAAAAVIERLRGVIDEWRTVIGGAAGCNPAWALDVMADKIRGLRQGPEVATARGEQCDEGARKNMADALGRPELKSWAEIEGAVRELVAERGTMIERIYRAETGDMGCVPDGVPVLCVRDVGADGCTIECVLPENYRLGAWDVFRVGRWRYKLAGFTVPHKLTGPHWQLELQPIDGAPVVPTGDRLTIAMERACSPDELARTGIATESSEAQLARIARAIEGDVDPSDAIADGATALIERLKDERARSEQRRLDLAEKMRLGPAISEWNYIAVHAERYGLLSEPVRRFALAMQATEKPNENAVRTELLDMLDGAAHRLRLAVADGEPASTVRALAARLALRAMGCAARDGDLDTFDAVAEIAAARGKSAD